MSLCRHCFCLFFKFRHKNPRTQFIFSLVLFFLFFYHFFSFCFKVNEKNNKNLQSKNNVLFVYTSYFPPRGSFVPFSSFSFPSSISFFQDKNISYYTTNANQTKANGTTRVLQTRKLKKNNKSSKKGAPSSCLSLLLLLQSFSFSSSSLLKSHPFESSPDKQASLSLNFLPSSSTTSLLSNSSYLFLPRSSSSLSAFFPFSPPFLSFSSSPSRVLPFSTFSTSSFSSSSSSSSLISVTPGSSSLLSQGLLSESSLPSSSNSSMPPSPPSPPLSPSPSPYPPSSSAPPCSSSSSMPSLSSSLSCPSSNSSSFPSSPSPSSPSPSSPSPSSPSPSSPSSSASSPFPSASSPFPSPSASSPSACSFSSSLRAASVAACHSIPSSCPSGISSPSSRFVHLCSSSLKSYTSFSISSSSSSLFSSFLPAILSLGTFLPLNTSLSSSSSSSSSSSPSSFSSSFLLSSLLSLTSFLSLHSLSCESLSSLLSFLSSFFIKFSSSSSSTPFRPSPPLPLPAPFFDSAESRTNQKRNNLHSNVYKELPPRVFPTDFSPLSMPPPASSSSPSSSSSSSLLHSLPSLLSGSLPLSPSTSSLSLRVHGHGRKQGEVVDKKKGRRMEGENQSDFPSSLLIEFIPQTNQQQKKRKTSKQVGKERRSFRSSFRLHTSLSSPPLSQFSLFSSTFSPYISKSYTRIRSQSSFSFSFPFSLYELVVRASSQKSSSKKATKTVKHSQEKKKINKRNTTAYKSYLPDCATYSSSFTSTPPLSSSFSFSSLSLSQSSSIDVCSTASFSFPSLSSSLSSSSSSSPSSSSSLPSSLPPSSFSPSSLPPSSSLLSSRFDSPHAAEVSSSSPPRSFSPSTSSHFSSSSPSFSSSPPFSSSFPSSFSSSPPGRYYSGEVSSKPFVSPPVHNSTKFNETISSSLPPSPNSSTLPNVFSRKLVDLEEDTKGGGRAGGVYHNMAQQNNRKKNNNINNNASHTNPRMNNNRMNNNNNNTRNNNNNRMNNRNINRFNNNNNNNNNNNENNSNHKNINNNNNDNNKIIEKTIKQIKENWKGKDNKYWLEKFGVPKKIPPGAWCTEHGMTISIPTNSSKFFDVYPIWRNLSPQWNSVENTLQNKMTNIGNGAEKKEKNEENNANTNDNECTVKLIKHFYTELKDNEKLDAWVGFAPHGKCGGKTIETNTHIYYTNVLRAPHAGDNVVGICACPKMNDEYKTKLAEKYSPCVPTARWEVDTMAKKTWKKKIIQNDNKHNTEGYHSDAHGDDNDSVVEILGEEEELLIKLNEQKRRRRKNGGGGGGGGRGKGKEEDEREEEGEYKEGEENEDIIGIVMGEENEEIVYGENVLSVEGGGGVGGNINNGKTGGGGGGGGYMRNNNKKNNNNNNKRKGKKLGSIARAITGGYVVSILATAGEENEMGITNSDERLVFESHAYGSELYPWPQECTAFTTLKIKKKKPYKHNNNNNNEKRNNNVYFKNEYLDDDNDDDINNNDNEGDILNNKNRKKRKRREFDNNNNNNNEDNMQEDEMLYTYSQNLIMGGCPVSPSLDFTVHPAAGIPRHPLYNPYGQDSGSIVFSFVPFAFFEEKLKHYSTSSSINKDEKTKRKEEHDEEKISTIPHSSSPMKIKCRMELYSLPPTVGQFCNQLAFLVDENKVKHDVKNYLQKRKKNNRNNSNNNHNNINNNNNSNHNRNNINSNHSNNNHNNDYNHLDDNINITENSNAFQNRRKARNERQRGRSSNFMEETIDEEREEFYNRGVRGERRGVEGEGGIGGGGEGEMGERNGPLQRRRERKGRNPSNENHDETNNNNNNFYQNTYTSSFHPPFFPAHSPMPHDSSSFFSSSSSSFFSDSPVSFPPFSPRGLGDWLPEKPPSLKTEENISKNNYIHNYNNNSNDNNRRRKDTNDQTSRAYFSAEEKSEKKEKRERGGGDAIILTEFGRKLLRRKLMAKNTKSMVLEKTKPNFIKQVQGPQQITGWKNFHGEDSMETYWKRREELSSIKRKKSLEEEKTRNKEKQMGGFSTDNNSGYNNQNINILNYMNFDGMTPEEELAERQKLLRLALFQEELSGRDPFSIKSIGGGGGRENTDKLDFFTSPPIAQHGLSAHSPYIQGNEGMSGGGEGGEGDEETLSGQIFRRYTYTRPNDRPLIQAENSIVYGPWAVDWARSSPGKTAQLSVGNNQGAVGVAEAALDRVQVANVNWGINSITVRTDEINESVKVGVLRGKYGVDIERSNRLQATSIETVSRFVETATLADHLDDIYGQRIRIRQFEFNFQRDFSPFNDAEQVLRNEIFMQELAINYKSLAVVIGADPVDHSYATSVGFRGYQFSALADIDARITDFQGNWGRGWQMILQGDFVDPMNSDVYGAVGFGRLGRAYIAVGAGVGSDGVPQGNAELETSNLGIAVFFLDDEGTRVLNYALALGKFAYTWESTVVVNNIRIPLLFNSPSLI